MQDVLATQAVTHKHLVNSTHPLVTACTTRSPALQAWANAHIRVAWCRSRSLHPNMTCDNRMQGAPHCRHPFISQTLQSRRPQVGAWMPPCKVQ
jgi:hypothetical protein